MLIYQCVLHACCKVSAVEKTLKDMRTDAEFQTFWERAEEISNQLEFEAPHLPQQRRVPLRLGRGETQPTYRNVEHYHQVTNFYPILDTVIGQIQERFSENVIGVIQNIEKVLLADSEGVSQVILKDVANYYDIDQGNLKVELRVFANLVKLMSQKN